MTDSTIEQAVYERAIQNELVRRYWLDKFVDAARAIGILNSSRIIACTCRRRRDPMMSGRRMVWEAFVVFDERELNLCTDLLPVFGSLKQARKGARALFTVLGIDTSQVIWT